MPTVSSLAKSLNGQIDARTSDCALIELKTDDSPSGNNLIFQYYPESFTDTKGVNYQQKEIFGASLPLYQWVAGGERIISFQAQFSTDVDLLDPSTQEGVTELFERLNKVGEGRRNVDIRAAVLWLRSFLLPSYGGGDSAAESAGVPLTFAPRKLILSMPGTGIGMAGGDDGQSGLDSVLCLMTQCDVTHEALFPSGLPRLSQVQLSFAQIPQFKGEVRFPSRTDFYDQLRAGRVNQGFLGYNLKPKGKVPTFG